jgi:hypothetical protein
VRPFAEIVTRHLAPSATSIYLDRFCVWMFEELAERLEAWSHEFDLRDFDIFDHVPQLFYAGLLHRMPVMATQTTLNRNTNLMKLSDAAQDIACVFIKSGEPHSQSR